MTPRSALGALHIGALMFGLTGVFGKLAAASPAIIVFGRATFAVLALAVFARFASNTAWKRLELRDWRRLAVSGVLLAAHWVTFFMAVKVAGVAVATLGFTAFPAFTVILEGLIFRERIRANEVLLVALVTVGHSGGGSTTLVLRSQGPAQGAGVAVGQVAPPDFDKFNFFESDSHFCAKVVPRDACEAAVAAAVAERALVKLPYIGAVKSLSLISD